MSPRLVLAALIVAILASADTAGAIIATNTIDRDVTYPHAGARARATGSIGCTTGPAAAAAKSNNRAARRSTLPGTRR